MANSPGEQVVSNLLGCLRRHAECQDKRRNRGTRDEKEMVGRRYTVNRNSKEKLKWL
jgi:hypothetical protein